MPYFMRKERDKYCVFKGMREDPGDLVKCHDTEDEASDHLRALLANVDDKKSVETGVGNLPDLPPPATSGPAEWESMTADEIMQSVGKRELESEKAPLTASQREALPDSAFLFIEPGGKKDSGGKTSPRNLRHLPYRTADGKIDLPRLRNAVTRLSQPRTGEVGGESWLTEEVRKRLLAHAQSLLKDATGSGHVDSDNTPDEKSLSEKFVTYKSGDTYRWLAIANTAQWDREGERLTAKSYDDAVEYGKSGGFGELDLVHVNGTDVGDADFMHRMGTDEEAYLIMGGQWYDDPRSIRARKSVESRPDYFGTSIKFVYDPEQFKEGVYHGGIRIKKCTILPRRMAASHGTAIAVLGGEQKMKELDQETKDALAELGVEGQEIESLAEQVKSLPDEQNTATKENTSILDQIKALIAKAFPTKETPEPEAAQPDVVEQSKETEAEVAPAEEAQEPVETKESDVENTPVEEPQPVASSNEETVKAIAQVVAQSLAPSIKEAVQPLTENLASIQQWQKSIEKRLLESEKDIETKVIERLEEQPPVVKVRATELKRNEEPVQPTTITDSPEANFSAEFMKGVKDIVGQAMRGYLELPEIKLSE